MGAGEESWPDAVELTPPSTGNAVELSAKSPSPSGRGVGVRGVESVATPRFDRPHPNPPPLGESLRGGRTVELNSTALPPAPLPVGEGSQINDYDLCRYPCHCVSVVVNACKPSLALLPEFSLRFFR